MRTLTKISVSIASAVVVATAMAAPHYQNPSIQVIQSYHNDISPALRDLPLPAPPKEQKDGDEREMRQPNLHPQLPLPPQADIPDPVIDHGLLGLLLPDVMPTTILNFDGIQFPGVACSCTPPDADGAVGLTQYVQVVNEAYQVFNKTTGASVLGPAALSTIWSGFGGACQNNSQGDPFVLFDHIANRGISAGSPGHRSRPTRVSLSRRPAMPPALGIVTPITSVVTFSPIPN
jgi:hypothetical protein